MIALILAANASPLLHPGAPNGFPKLKASARESWDLKEGREWKLAITLN